MAVLAVAVHHLAVVDAQLLLQQLLHVAAVAVVAELAWVDACEIASRTFVHALV